MVVVVEALGDELEDGELALGELRERPARASCRRTWASSVTACGQGVVEHDVAGGDGPQGVLDPLRPGALDEVAAGPVAQRRQRGVVVLRHRQHDHLDGRVVLGQPAVDLEPGAVDQADVEEHDVRRAPRRRARRPGRRAGPRRRARCRPSRRSPRPGPSGTSGGRRRWRPAATPARSVTAAPPAAGRARGCRGGALARQRHGAAELGGPLAHRRQPDAGACAAADADAVVDDVDLDRRAGGDRQPAARGPGVAHDVRDGLGDDAVGRHLDGGRQVDRCRRQREVDLQLVAERPGELGDRADEAELVERRRPQVAHDPLELDDDAVDLVGDAGEQRARRRRPRRPSTDRSSWRSGRAQPERDARQRRAQTVVQVASQPAPLLLAGRHDGQARSAQVGGQAHPADGQAERADELVEHLLVALAQRRAVLPADDEAPDRRRRGGAASTTRRWVVAGPVSAARCQPSATRRSMATASRRSSRWRLSTRAGRRSSPESAPRWSTTRWTTASGIVAGAVHEAVDEPADVLTGRLEGQRDRAGRGDEEPRRAAAADQAAEPGDDARVDDDDAAGQHGPLDDAVRHAVVARRDVADGVDDRAADEQRHGGDEAAGPRRRRDRAGATRRAPGRGARRPARRPPCRRGATRRADRRIAGRRHQPRPCSAVADRGGERGDPRRRQRRRVAGRRPAAVTTSTTMTAAGRPPGQPAPGRRRATAGEQLPRGQRGEGPRAQRPGPAIGGPQPRPARRSRRASAKPRYCVAIAVTVAAAPTTTKHAPRIRPRGPGQQGGADDGVGQADHEPGDEPPVLALRFGVGVARPASRPRRRRRRGRAAAAAAQARRAGACDGAGPVGADPSSSSSRSLIVLPPRRHPTIAGHEPRYGRRCPGRMVLVSPRGPGPTRAPAGTRVVTGGRCARDGRSRTIEAPHLATKEQPCPHPPHLARMAVAVVAVALVPSVAAGAGRRRRHPRDPQPRPAAPCCRR